VNKFGSSTLGKHSVKDSLLSAAGALKTLEARDQTNEWLERHGKKVDAVISSNLERTMHTAALQYPGLEVHVVPFIKGSSAWYTMNMENRAKAIDYQAHEIKNVAPSFKYTDEYLALATKWSKDAHKDWDKFKTLLAQHLLPDLVTNLKKEPEDDIVVAVVTQPEFMDHGEVFEKCGKHLYTESPRSKKKKANRNQVVSLSMFFDTHTPDKDLCTLTKQTYSLQEAATCDQVATGIELFPEGVGAKNGTTEPKPICARDVGDVCEKSVAQGSYVVEKRLGSLEKHIEKTKASITKKEKEITDLQVKDADKKNSKATSALKQLQADLDGYNKEEEETAKTKCWTPGQFSQLPDWPRGSNPPQAASANPPPTPQQPTQAKGDDEEEKENKLAAKLAVAEDEGKAARKPRPRPPRPTPRASPQRRAAKYADDDEGKAAPRAAKLADDDEGKAARRPPMPAGPMGGLADALKEGKKKLKGDGEQSSGAPAVGGGGGGERPPMPTGLAAELAAKKAKMAAKKQDGAVAEKPRPAPGAGGLMGDLKSQLAAGKGGLKKVESPADGQKGSGGGGLMGDLKSQLNGVKLKKMERPAEGQKVSGGGGVMGDLKSQLNGVKLKKMERPAEEKKKPVGGMYGELAEKLQQRRAVVQDDEKEEDDDNEWDD